MRFSILFTVVSGALVSAIALPEIKLITLEKRGCFSGGNFWDVNLDKALGLAKRACQNGIAGSWPEGPKQRSRCYKLDDATKVNFHVKKIVDGAQSLSLDDCVDKLHHEINTCEHGGSTSYSSFEFT